MRDLRAEAMPLHAHPSTCPSAVEHTAGAGAEQARVVGFQNPDSMASLAAARSAESRVDQLPQASAASKDSIDQVGQVGQVACFHRDIFAPKLACWTCSRHLYCQNSWALSGESLWGFVSVWIAKEVPRELAIALG